MNLACLIELTPNSNLHQVTPVLLFPLMVLLPLILLVYLPHHELGIKAHDSPSKIPITIQTNPVLNVEWMFPCCLGSREDAKGITCLAGALAVFGHILDLLVDVLRFHDFVEILDNDLAAGTCRICTVVRPACRVDSPASTAVYFLEFLEDVESANEDNFAAGFAKGWDLRVGVPPASWASMISVSEGLCSRKSMTSRSKSRKYLSPVRDMGNVLCTKASSSLALSLGNLGCTRMSKKRTPFLSCSRGLTAWQRTEGGATWHVGELCVPGMDNDESKVSSLSSRIHAFKFADEKTARWDSAGVKIPVNRSFASLLSGFMLAVSVVGTGV
ncbi:uncharacterized protein BDW70DRAFT_153970 [Aspergillus foveolatus]|uniref:uncharacterized protein n=1 Tax=Aspergillus foveolatus TaxID=210207 RepID=UPI003CCDB2F5